MGQERLQAGYINTVERPLSGPPSTGCSINRIHRGVKDILIPPITGI
ncbi:hypothetical protein M513_03146 [Trichuris suis]|uniref:Uncharacterized protein n=1 Tax=Trichuris suis TaxID=68888 RepID=A0A085MFM6_9BILA|nr:hypothetical protein M513_03146 [Trichuris suis]